MSSMRRVIQSFRPHMYSSFWPNTTRLARFWIVLATNVRDRDVFLSTCSVRLAGARLVTIGALVPRAAVEPDVTEPWTHRATGRIGPAS